MASIKKRKNKDGITSYLIRVSDGYGTDGKQRKLSMKWIPPHGMSEKRADKEAEKEALRFEDSVKRGMATLGNTRIEEFSKIWLAKHVHPNLKRKTASEYEKRLERINQALGHKKLRDLRTKHLNEFYLNLQEDGMHKRTGGKLSSETVRTYHRIVSSLLGYAVSEELILFNPAQNATLPRQDKKEAPHLDETESRRLLELLHDEPIKYRTMITFDLLSGLRRGELLGLRWQDVDFESETIRIVQTLQYVSGHGLITDTPKNKTSIRELKLSRTAFVLLREYKDWQDKQREICGDYWKNTGNLVFTGDDGTIVHPDGLTKWFSAFIKRTELPHVSIHSLRHTYASLMIADGTPLVVVSKRLGHAQVSTTANIYAHMIQSADEKASTVTDKFNDSVIRQSKPEQENAIMISA